MVAGDTNIDLVPSIRGPKLLLAWAGVISEPLAVTIGVAANESALAPNSGRCGPELDAHRR